MGIAFISYYFLESDGVGSLRPLSLAKFLEQEGKAFICYNKYSFGKWASKYKIVWCCFLFFSLMHPRIGKIYITCGPFWHLIWVLIASKLLNKDLICDFRDPWSFNIRRSYGLPNRRINPIKVLISESIERLTYQVCYRFWVCTPGMYQLYTQLFKDNQKLDLIPNGYDFSFDPKKIKTNKSLDVNENTLRFVCLGRFAEENLGMAKRALEQIKQYILKYGSDSVSIDFIGTPLYPTYSLLAELDLEYISVFHPKMPYLDAITLASKSNMGLCVVRDEEFELGSKAFDYIGLGLPIFDCFTPGSQFHEFFKLFLSREPLKKSSLEIRELYSRQSAFKKTLRFW